MGSSKISLTIIIILSVLSSSFAFPFSFYKYNLTAVNLPSLGFNSVTASPDCNQDFTATSINQKPTANNLKLRLNHRPLHRPNTTKTDSLLSAAHNDLTHIHSLFRRIISDHAHHLLDPSSLLANHNNSSPDLAGRVIATINSGVPLGSGEYFINAFVGTPPAHFSLILDTGSDLNWLQCLPCHDCFYQRGPVFDPAASSSYRLIPCSDTRCSLVTPPDAAPPCSASDAAPPCSASAPCPYFYWYGDRSNTTGDLAVETFTVNLTSTTGNGSESHKVDDVIFGCGHWNRGLFHGAAGLLGLGRGPLSFASQLRTLYGHTFSYCLVDRNSDLSVSSKLVFGEDQTIINDPKLNYTSFVTAPTDTFYYVQVKAIRVGGEVLKIPAETWDLGKDGAGGTIIDSGTTLSYFADPAYDVIREAFVKRVKYPVIGDFPVLTPCYNVSGLAKAEMPGFSIEFGDGAVWDFPVENYFIRLEPEEIMCLAILGTPRSSLSIIGNYQQQNFHMLYDTERSRLGFAPMRCAEV